MLVYENKIPTNIYTYILYGTLNIFRDGSKK